jgi:hypothetical protein
MELQQESQQWFDDEDFQDNLAALLYRDPITLRDCAKFLTPDDFKALRGMHYGYERGIIVECALEHYEKHHTPLGKLLRSSVLEYADGLQYGASKLAKLKEYLEKILKLKVASPAAITSKVIAFKSQHLKAEAIQELQDLLANGMLTDEKWLEISRRALKPMTEGRSPVDYLAGIDTRIARRKQRVAHIPWTFIDPLDTMIHCVGRRQLGLVIAPYKRGKSIFLLWLAVAYALQHMNVLYFTLEDSGDTVDDRLDSIVSYLPLKRLGEMPRQLKKRFNRKKAMMTNLHIYDGTDETMTVPRIAQVVEEEREKGFMPDAIIVDYDEEISSTKKWENKRFESDEVYRDFRKMLAKYDAIGWLAAQTQRGTRDLKILTGDKVAEDIGKLKKVTCGLTLGKGEWTENSFYLWVAAHKNDKMDIGCEIIPDLDRMLVYDREATRKEARAHAYTP